MILTSSSIKTKAGVGYSQKEDSFEVGVEIASMALQKTGLLQETLFFLFATPLHKIDELKRGIRMVIGDSSRFLGCTTTGLVTCSWNRGVERSTYCKPLFCVGW